VWNVKTGMLGRELSESAIPFENCYWQESRLSGRGMPLAASHDWDETCLAYSLAYSPDCKIIAVGSKLWLRLWDAESGAVLRTFPGAAEIGAIAFSPEGGQLASSGENGRVDIWNVSTGSQVRELQLSDRPLRAIAFSPDGQHLAASGWDGTIYICDSKSGTLVRKIVASRGAVNWVFFSSEGADIVSGSRDDDFFAIWQVSTGKLVHQISCHSVVSP
jgi:WD40 repeat protein